MSAEDDVRAIEGYLHRRIPIAAAIGVRVRTAGSSYVRLSAPIAPNINVEPERGAGRGALEHGAAGGMPQPGADAHGPRRGATGGLTARGAGGPPSGTAPPGPMAAEEAVVFGGSAAAVAILAAWTLLYVRERARGGGARLVIQRSTIHYERPITGDFEAVCELTDEADYARFERTLARRGRARITLRSALLQDGRRAASFEGDFVALRGA